MIDQPVNTGGNRPGTFTKGDPRINRRGRPRTFEAFRKLAVKIAGEQADEEEITRAVKMLRDMARSRAPADRALFLAYAYGKPRETVDINIPGATITLNWRTLEKDEDKPAPIAPTPG